MYTEIKLMEDKEIKMKVVVGTRGSKLALTQTNWVIQELKKKHPMIEFEIKIIKTKGDLIQNVSLDKIGDKGLFVKEIDGGSNRYSGS